MIIYGRSERRRKKKRFIETLKNEQIRIKNASP